MNQPAAIQASQLRLREHHLFLAVSVLIGILAGLAAVLFSLAIDRVDYLLFGFDPSPVRTALVPLLVMPVLMAAFVLLQPDFKGAFLLFALAGTMLFLGGVAWRHLSRIMAVGVPVAILVMVLEPYRMRRLTAYFDPSADVQGISYQINQSLISLGSGGWFGVGLTSSRQKYAFLPMAHTDFIVSIMWSMKSASGTPAKKPKNKGLVPGAIVGVGLGSVGLIASTHSTVASAEKPASSSSGTVSLCAVISPTVSAKTTKVEAISVDALLSAIADRLTCVVCAVTRRLWTSLGNS